MIFFLDYSTGNTLGYRDNVAGISLAFLLLPRPCNLSHMSSDDTQSSTDSRQNIYNIIARGILRCEGTGPLQRTALLSGNIENS